MAARSTCLKCAAPLSQPAKGRPLTYCSMACRRSAEFELRRVQGALTMAEAEAESSRRAVETRERGLAAHGGTMTPAIERLELEQATRRLAELDERLRELLSEGDDDG